MLHKTIYCPRKSGIASLRPSILSSILMAIGGMGDALLYVYLPVKGDALGMTAFSIGLLLSINKFARFFTNRWIAWLADKWSIRNVFFIGLLLSSITTIIYALNPVIWLWLFARLVWGVAFSALRFSTIQYADKSVNSGSALGIGRGIQEAGPLLAYWVGPIMLASFGAGVTFSSWALFLIALWPLFLLLPNVEMARQEIKPFSFQKPAWIDTWVFISSFAVEGLLIVGISEVLTLDTTNTDQLIFVAALYISARRFLNVVISPLTGWISDMWSFSKVFNISCLCVAVGLGIITLGMKEIGLFLTYIGSAVNITLVPLMVIRLSRVERSFNALTRMSTSRDLGSAVGSLVGLSLLIAFDQRIIFFILTVIIISVWLKIRKLDFNHE